MPVNSHKGHAGVNILPILRLTAAAQAAIEDLKFTVSLRNGMSQYFYRYALRQLFSPNIIPSSMQRRVHLFDSVEHLLVRQRHMVEHLVIVLQPGVGVLPDTQECSQHLVVSLGFSRHAEPHLCLEYVDGAGQVGPGWDVITQPDVGPHSARWVGKWK